MKYIDFDVDSKRVFECVKDNDRFISPFYEPYSYYICIHDQSNGFTVDENVIQLYLSKLKYAVQNTDALLDNVYRMFHSKVDLPKELWIKLIFESFVLAADVERIGCCLSNKEFMPGHFIECRWTLNWEPFYMFYS